MTKPLILLTLPILLLATTALAAPNPTNIDCATAKTVGLQYIKYSEPVKFPNEPRSVTIDLYTYAKPLSICGVTVTRSAKDGTMTFQGKDLAALDKVMNLIPGQYQFSNEVWNPMFSEFDLQAYFVLTMDKGSTPQISASRSSDYDKDISVQVAASVDNGKLTPLLYNSKETTVNVSPNVRKINVYFVSNSRLLWQRMEFDVQHARLTLYKKAALPKN